MRAFKDLRPEGIRSINAPVMVMVGDADMLRPEHAVEMFLLLPHAQLALLPSTTHFTLMHRADLLLSMIPPFLDAPMQNAR